MTSGESNFYLFKFVKISIGLSANSRDWSKN